MDYTTMQDRVKLWLGQTDTTNTYYTPTEVSDLVNDAIEEVALETECLLTFATITTTASVGRYALPLDFSQMRNASVDKTATRRYVLAQSDFDDFEISTSGNYTLQGEPAYFKIEIGATDTAATRAPGDIWLYPVPDSNGGNDYTLRIHYLQIPDRLSTGTDVSELPKQLHRAVTYYAAILLANKSSDDQKAQKLTQLYQHEIQRYMASKNQREMRRYIAKNVYQSGSFWGKSKPQGWR